MKKTLVSSLIFASFFSYAQLSVGYLHDLDKLPVHGTINPREYNPENLLVLVHRSDAFEKGTVYYSDGRVEDGLIKYENKKIWYKPSEYDNQDKLKPDEIRALTIGIDSFFVANYFNIEQEAITRQITEPQFMQYLTAFDGLTFAKHYHFSSGIAQTYTMTSPIVETYQVSEDGGETWLSFPKQKMQFKTMALKYFGHVPYLTRKIQNESIESDDILTLINSSEYYYKYQNNELIYFDKYWNPISEAEESTYTAAVKSLEDSIWTISYLKDGFPLYEASYHSLFPHKLHGDIKIFSQEESVVQKIAYKNNEKKSESIAYPSGGLHYSYEIMDIYDGYNTYPKAKYNQILDANGNSLVQLGNWKEEVSTTLGIITNEFYDNNLTKSYRTSVGKPVHHIIDPKYNFKLQKLQNKLNFSFSGDNYLEAVEDNAQGMYFLHVTISEKGRAINCEIFNEVHPTLDSKIKNWVNNNLKETSYYAHKFKPYKIDNKKVSAEFLIPLQFSIIKFYRQPANNNYNWQFHNQMMFNQMHMQPLNLPTPPMGF
jgi:hypothetical protein